MNPQKLQPGQAPAAFRGRLEAVFPEQVFDSLATDLKAEVDQSALKPGISPGGIVLGHLEKDLDETGGLPWSAGSFSALREVPFLANQVPVPAEESLGLKKVQGSSQALEADPERRLRKVQAIGEGGPGPPRQLFLEEADLGGIRLS